MMLPRFDALLFRVLAECANQAAWPRKPSLLKIYSMPYCGLGLYIADCCMAGLVIRVKAFCKFGLRNVLEHAQL